MLEERYLRRLEKLYLSKQILSWLRWWTTESRRYFWTFVRELLKSCWTFSGAAAERSLQTRTSALRASGAQLRCWVLIFACRVRKVPATARSSGLMKGSNNLVLWAVKCWPDFPGETSLGSVIVKCWVWRTTKLSPRQTSGCWMTDTAITILSITPSQYQKMLEPHSSHFTLTSHNIISPSYFILSCFCCRSNISAPTKDGYWWEQQSSSGVWRSFPEMLDFPDRGGWSVPQRSRGEISSKVSRENYFPLQSVQKDIDDKVTQFTGKNLVFSLFEFS